jgi:hypothetical protein
MEYRACVDCKWFARGDDGLTCTNPLYSEFDPVHGWLAQPAQQVRRHTGLLCGPSGKGWEKRVHAPDYASRVAMIFVITFSLLWTVKMFL